MMIVDRNNNISGLQSDPPGYRSCPSFGIVATNRQLVRKGQAFRKRYQATAHLQAVPVLVSPLNARQQLTAFIRGPKELLFMT
jgi:hypothetical protein